MVNANTISALKIMISVTVAIQTVESIGLIAEPRSVGYIYHKKKCERRLPEELYAAMDKAYEIIYRDVEARDGGELTDSHEKSLSNAVGELVDRLASNPEDLEKIETLYEEMICSI